MTIKIKSPGSPASNYSRSKEAVVTLESSCLLPTLPAALLRRAALLRAVVVRRLRRRLLLLLLRGSVDAERVGDAAEVLFRVTAMLVVLLHISKKGMFISHLWYNCMYIDMTRYDIYFLSLGPKIKSSDNFQSYFLHFMQF